MPSNGGDNTLSSTPDVEWWLRGYVQHAFRHGWNLRRQVSELIDTFEEYRNLPTNGNNINSSSDFRQIRERGANPKIDSETISDDSVQAEAGSLEDFRESQILPSPQPTKRSEAQSFVKQEPVDIEAEAKYVSGRRQSDAGRKESVQTVTKVPEDRIAIQIPPSPLQLTMKKENDFSASFEQKIDPLTDDDQPGASGFEAASHKVNDALSRQHPNTVVVRKLLRAKEEKWDISPFAGRSPSKDVLATQKLTSPTQRGHISPSTRRQNPEAKNSPQDAHCSDQNNQVIRNRGQTGHHSPERSLPFMRTEFKENQHETASQLIDEQTNLASFSSTPKLHYGICGRYQLPYANQATLKPDVMIDLTNSPVSLPKKRKSPVLKTLNQSPAFKRSSNDFLDTAEHTDEATQMLHNSRQRSGIVEQTEEKASLADLSTVSSNESWFDDNDTQDLSDPAEPQLTLT